MKITRDVIYGVAVLAFSALLPMAVGAAAFNMPGSPFERADTNHDGVLTKAEMEQAAIARFHAFDTAGTGKITRADFDKTMESMGKTHMDQMFSAMDTKHDGKVTKEEFEAFAAQKSKEMADRRFAMLDKDNKGYITKEQLDARAPGRDRKFSGRTFERLDTGKKGYLTESDFVAEANRMFDRMDKNKDGKVDVNEMMSNSPMGGGAGKMPMHDAPPAE